MFKSSVDGLNHQASFGFSALTADLTRIQDSRQRFSPSAGHSFDQYIHFDGQDLLFVDQADYSPRGFTFSKRSLKGDMIKNWFIPFKFKQGKTYQYTYAQLGGVVSTDQQYLFVGSSEKTSLINPSSPRLNESRNVFIQLIGRSLAQSSEPIWITNYSDAMLENAAQPKVVNLENGKNLILWEKHKGSDNGYKSYLSTYMALVDSNGSVIKVEELPKVRLEIGGDIHFNSKRKSVQWAVNDAKQGLKIYELDPMEYSVADSKLVIKFQNEQPPREYTSDDVGVRLNGKYVELTPKAKVIDESTFIPLRGVFEAMGATIKWNPVTKQVIITRETDSDTTKVVLTIGSTKASVNTSEVTLAVAPFISKDGSTYVPLRFASEALGADVGWEAEKLTAVITQSD